VKVTAAGNDGSVNGHEWQSSIIFAPDRHSAGLTVRVTGHVLQDILVSPSSLILDDDPAAKETTVALIGSHGNPFTIDQIHTNLPLLLDVLKASPTASSRRVIRLRINDGLSRGMSGTITVLVNQHSRAPGIVSIPVVLLHQEAATDVAKPSDSK
jgi:hypothetical protein